MKQQEPQMRQRLETAGLAVGSINYALQRGNASYHAALEASVPDSNVDTKLLYQTAKCVIETVKNAENEV